MNFSAEAANLSKHREVNFGKSDFRFLKRSLTDDNAKIWRTALALTLFLLFFESCVFRVGYFAYAVFLHDSQPLADGSLIVILSLIPFYLFYRFVVFALSTTWFYKTICFAAFTFSLLVEYGYQKALGRFSMAGDLENLVVTTPEQQITSLSIYLSWTILVPCSVFLACLLLVKKKNDALGIKHFVLNLLLLAIFFGGLSAFHNLFIEHQFPTVSLAAFCRTSADFLITDFTSGGKVTAQLTGKQIVRRAVTAPLLAANYFPSNNIVLVIDESVRGDHLSLNGYERKTTPFLDGLATRGVLHNWGLAAAASTGSRFSYNAIMSGLTPDDFPDKTGYKIGSFPTLFQYAKAMRYETHYFDGQMNHYWAGVEDDKNYLDRVLGVNNFTADVPKAASEIDNRMARKIKEILCNSKGNFVVVFKRGSHIPYNNFPSDAQTWQPSYFNDDQYGIPPSNKLDEVVNAYDNSLKYNIDSFFKNLVDDYSQIPNNTLIIYTGDHGQTLFENGRASHGGDTKTEAVVPLFIIGKLNAQVDTDYRAAHQNLYPTLLDLMNYPENLRERAIIPSLLKARSADSSRRFFSPNLDRKIAFD